MGSSTCVCVNLKIKLLFYQLDSLLEQEKDKKTPESRL